MKQFLNFIGIGSAFYPEAGNTSAFLKVENGKRLIMFDCGENVFERVKCSDILTDVKTIDIFITHTHSDHIGSLGTLLAYVYYILNIKANVYDINPKSRLREILDLTGVLPNLYKFNPLLQGARVELGEDIVINGFKIKHYDTIDSTAYEIMHDGKLVLYTGDYNDVAIFADHQVADLYDIIYTDCSCKKFPGNPHAYLGDLKTYIPMGMRDRVYCMHIESEEAILEIKKAGFNVVEIYNGKA